MYLTIRALHVLAGAIWVGAAVLSALWLVPMTSDLGPDAAKVGESLRRRGYVAAIPVISLVAILSGVWLYWRYTGGFSPEASGTHSAMAFGAGGVLSVLAFLIGALFIGRNMMKAMALAKQIGPSTSDADRQRLARAAESHRERAAVAGQIVAALVVVTIVLMSIGHYL